METVFQLIKVVLQHHHVTASMDYGVASRVEPVGITQNRTGNFFVLDFILVFVGIAVAVIILGAVWPVGEGAQTHQAALKREMESWPSWMMFLIFFCILAAYFGVPYFTRSGGLGFFAAVSVPLLFFETSLFVRKIREWRANRKAVATRERNC